tara:strand:+ start:65 stop:274 length:210 start_codon:yes stop_codon:yes gene_type:complete
MQYPYEIDYKIEINKNNNDKLNYKRIADRLENNKKKLIKFDIDSINSRKNHITNLNEKKRKFIEVSLNL